jgi:putative transposase
MCNKTIAIAIQRNPKNRFELTKIAYPQLKRYGLRSHYILSACEVAFSVFRNKKRKSVPYIREPFLKLDNLTYQLNHLLLRIPTSPRNFVFVTLVGSDYHLSLVDDPNLKRGSVTITPRSVNIAFNKEIEPFEPIGHIGLDINERNVTVSATDDWYRQFSEVCEVVEIKERYRDIRASIAKKVRGDRRIAKTLLTKYGRKERDRTLSRLHKVSKKIVKYARHSRLDIRMEKLKGIRKLYRKGNGQGPFYRARMNTWVFGETQRQVDYKARWDGVPDYFVNPRGTSSNCPDCGSRVVPLARRKLYCPMCDKTWDRDDLASKNIMACAVPQARPSRRSEEGEPRRREDAGNPQSRWGEGRVEG